MEKPFEQDLEDENRRLKEQLRLYQEYDSLTGLYNKDTFYHKVEAYFACHFDETFTIICVDIENFKLFNDLNGTEQGDYLLQYLAATMKMTLPVTDDLIARLSGDVFGMCIPMDQTDETTQEILRIFQDYSQTLPVTPAIGFYLVNDCSIPVNLMCDRAIIALNSIKKNYLSHIAEYDNSMRHAMLEEQELLEGAEVSLANREFEVYLQPKCNMNTGKIIGAETLVRWNHPQKGMIAPNSFIPFFEQNGFVRKLDLYIWEETVSWLRRWVDAGHPPIPISVNISRIDIYGMDLCSLLENLLNRYDMDPSFLELEITESAYVHQPEIILAEMEKLMSHGFTVLMDDFGSGYSSLNMLKDINVDILKIDMRFLEKDDKKSKGILESVVHMSRLMGLPVIAEGVEFQNQVDFLLSIGCLYAQGYFYYRPMPIKDFEELLADEKNVDYQDRGKLSAEQNSLLDFHELFHRDVMSDRMLGNILGAIAVYAYDTTGLHILRGNEEYYRLVGSHDVKNRQEVNLFTHVAKDDVPLLKDALYKAKNSSDESGETAVVRIQNEDQLLWIQLRIFLLSENIGQDIYYASLTDVTSHMESIEKLQMSEERFRVAMEATNIVIFELDIKTREASYSEYAQKAFGLSATVSNAPEGFIKQGTVCEESVDTFCAIYEEIYRGADRASCVIRARMGDGSIAWNRVTLIAVKNRHSRTIKAVGMVEVLAQENTTDS